MVLQENDILWLDLTIEDLTEKTETLGLNILGVDQDLIEEQFTNEYHEVIILPHSRYINMSIEEFNKVLPNDVFVKGVSSDKKRSSNIYYLKKFFSNKYMNLYFEIK